MTPLLEIEVPLPDPQTDHQIEIENNKPSGIRVDEVISVNDNQPPPTTFPPTMMANRNEQELTAEIGKQLGFVIDAEDPILKEVLGEAGEIILPQ